MCICLYRAQTKVFDQEENFHTNTIKVDLFINEYVLKQEEILYFVF